MTSMRSLCLLMAMALSLSACGVKKPLSIPTQKEIDARQKRDEYRAQKLIERQKSGVPGDDDDDDDKKRDMDDDDDNTPRIFNW